MFSPATAIPEIEAMLAKQKSFNEWPDWLQVGSKANGRWEFVSTLACDGVGIPGLRVRGSALRDIMDREITIQMEGLVGQRWLHICRADYRPLGAHLNPLDRRNFVRIIPAGTSHLHRFDDNVSDGTLDDLHPKRNLPIARVIEPPPSSVKRFLDTVGSTLGVPDLAAIALPDWQGGLPL